jgi:hypothetical protein
MAPSSPVQGVWFPQWFEVLTKAGLNDSERRTFRRAIGEYLGFCKQLRQRRNFPCAIELQEIAALTWG